VWRLGLSYSRKKMGKSLLLRGGKKDGSCGSVVQTFSTKKGAAPIYRILCGGGGEKKDSSAMIGLHAN